MGKLTELIKKDLKLLVRSKSSSLIILVGPLLLVALLGMAYSQTTGFIFTASVYSPAYSEMSDSLIVKLADQNFKMVKMGILDDCVNSVKRGESQACLSFPANMSVEGNKVNEITFFVDYSQINLVWVIIDAMNTQVSESSSEISKGIADDILKRVWFIEGKLISIQDSSIRLTAAGQDIMNSSGELKNGFKALDIKVDFTDLDMDEGRSSANAILPILSDLKGVTISLQNDTRYQIEDIKDSLKDIEELANSSSVSGEITDIKASLADLDDYLTAALLEMDDLEMNVSGDVDGLLVLFDAIDSKIVATNSKINNVRKARDDLLPGFDNVSLKAEDMILAISNVRIMLDESLQKIRALKGKDAGSITSPITTRIEPIASQKTHFNSLYPTLLVLIIMITGVLLASTLVIGEKKSKAFFRNHITPTSFFTFSFGTYLTGLIVLSVQILLFVSISGFFFETEVVASIWILLLLILLISTVFLCIGMLIGFLFRTEETVTLASITLASIFLLFSNAVIPLESLPAYLKSFAAFNPFVVSELALRQALIFHFSFMNILMSMGVLLLYGVVIFGVLLLFQDALRKLSFTHFHLHLTDKFSKVKRGSFTLFRHSEPKTSAMPEVKPADKPTVPPKQAPATAAMVQDKTKKI